MNLQHQIKTYRTSLHLTQDELSEKIFVSRQTISNWESGKNYPDINSLLLLSDLFNISLDQLVKGDVDAMTDITTSSSNELQKFKRAGNIFTTLLVLFVISFMPLLYFLYPYGLVISGALFVSALYFSLQVEKHKKFNDIQTYREIIAFLNGEKLDKIMAIREKEKRSAQKWMLASFTALIMLTISLIFYILFERFF